MKSKYTSPTRSIHLEKIYRIKTKEYKENKKEKKVKTLFIFNVISH